jgi:hypothetical protein
MHTMLHSASHEIMTNGVKPGVYTCALSAVKLLHSKPCDMQGTYVCLCA